MVLSMYLMGILVRNQVKEQRYNHCMTQREFNKEVRSQFEMIWKVLAPEGTSRPYMQYHCDKRVNGRRRIFKAYTGYATPEVRDLVRKVWQIISNSTSDQNKWVVVDMHNTPLVLRRNGYTHQSNRFIALANWS